MALWAVPVSYTHLVASGRIVNSTGVGNGSGGGTEQSSASVYLSIGNAIPTPAPETIEEVRVNASMYDAQQGSTSGAHIDMSTKSGTNDLHGAAFFHRGTNWITVSYTHLDVYKRQGRLLRFEALGCGDD